MHASRRGNACIGIYFYYYNRFQILDNRIDEAWSQIDVMLKKRHDLIPNLVNTVKGYASHEREVLEEVIKARAGLISGSRQERMETEQQLEGAQACSVNIFLDMYVLISFILSLRYIRSHL